MQYMTLYLTCDMSGTKQVKEIQCGMSVAYPSALEVKEMSFLIQWWWHCIHDSVCLKHNI